MSHKPSWLEEQQIHLSNDSTALVSYDREADILEITFQDAAASATIELTEVSICALIARAGNH